MDVNMNKHYGTWIIAFCPDSDSFFVTDQRFFFWESKDVFRTKDAAIKYFEDNLSYFIDIKNEIMSKCIYEWKPENFVWFDNTCKKYELEK